ncbi:MAG TPA: metal-dependent hydrolase [Candidatus Binatia bacterium]|nr:metal-dependent hydrolase [Candidatus Binatia bacterium]
MNLPAPAPASGTASPAVVQRDIHFGLGGASLRDWHPLGPHVSQYFNAMSLFFPEGEQFFIDSVRHYRDRVTAPRQLEDVRGFIGQEAMHGREHRAYNQALADAGYPAVELEAKALKQLKLARRLLPRSGQLAVTIALEHLTAIMAESLLGDERVLAGAPPQIAALWRWHAIEETEHKAVAYDVYQLAVGGGPKGYFLRCAIMLTATLRFIWQTMYTHYRLMKHDGLQRDWHGWRGLMRFLFVSPGVTWKIVLPWLSYFRPGFHPWQKDNRHHVERWKAEYAAQASPP